MPLFSRITFLDKLLFTKHLATIIKAGITISEGLSILIDQTKSAKFKKILKSLLANIQNGQSLAKSLTKHPRVFDQFYLSLIEVGEESGTLEQSLEFLSKQLSKDYSLRQKIKSAMLYPGLVFTATAIMGSFISLFILPKLVVFFEAFEIDLPLATKILLFFANFMKNYGLFLFLGLFILALINYFLVQTKFIKPLWHRFMIKLPLFGELLLYGQLARFSRNFGTLLKSGVPIGKSLETTANTLSNLKFQKDLLIVKNRLMEGKNIGQALEKEKFSEFPPLVYKMISVGEKTGKLDETLLYLGDFYEDEIDSLSKNLSTLLEPILLISIGLIVGFIGLAIISPIYELTGSIRR